MNEQKSSLNDSKDDNTPDEDVSAGQETSENTVDSGTEITPNATDFDPLEFSSPDDTSVDGVRSDSIPQDTDFDKREKSL